MQATEGQISDRSEAGETGFSLFALAIGSSKRGFKFSRYYWYWLRSFVPFFTKNNRMVFCNEIKDSFMLCTMTNTLGTMDRNLNKRQQKSGEKRVAMRTVLCNVVEIKHQRKQLALARKGARN